MPAETSSDILIAGAGIAGLTAAIACAQRGVSVTVIEQADKLAEVGAGLQLQPNATRVLHALGLEHELKKVSVQPQALTLREARSGRLLTRVSLQSTVGSLPYYQIHRADLQKILLEKALALNVQLELDQQVLSYHQTSSQASLQTQQGNTYTASAIIGADGIRSQIQSSMLGTDKPVFTGHVCYRGLVKADKLKRPIAPGAIAGPGRHFVMYYLRNGEWVNFVAQHEETEWKEESWTTAGDADALRLLYQDWDPEVTELLSHVDDTFKWALYSRPALERWSDGRVCLIGDACHPTLPNLASGAAMAIEDGYIIAELLERYGDDIPTAFKQFYKLRIARCTKIQKASRRMAKLFHIRSPLERALKHSAIIGLSKLAPQLAARQMTWTHHYNALTAISKIRSEGTK